MNKARIIFILLVISRFTMIAQGNFTSFLSIVKQGDMNFQAPLNMTETQSIKNDELNYQYAIKDSINNIEIRYVVYPLQAWEKKYNSGEPDTLFNHIDPNFIHTNLLISYSLKIQGKDIATEQAMPEVHELAHATADQEFNADWAAEVNLLPCDEFAQNYKYCTMLGLHKDNIADAFVIVLYNDSNNFNAILQPLEQSLKFKNR